MCFKKKKKEVERLVIRKPESTADTLIEIVEQKCLQADADTYVVVPSGFCAIVDIEGIQKQVLSEGTHRIELDKNFGDTQGRVTYVNRSEITTVLWGTEQYDYMDAILEMPIRMSFRGSAKLKVSDVEKFVSAMLGNKRTLTTRNVDEYFTSVIATHVMKITADVMITAKISYVEYAVHILEITQNITASVKQLLLDNYGLEVCIFTIEPPFYADRQAMEHLAKDLEQKRRLALRGSDFANEENKALQEKETKYKQNMEVLTTLTSAVKDSTPQAPTVNVYTSQRHCQACGVAVNADAAFCPKCGAKLNG